MNEFGIMMIVAGTLRIGYLVADLFVPVKSLGVVIVTNIIFVLIGLVLCLL